MNNLKPITEQEQKTLLMQMLKQIDEFCTNNKLTYFLYFGTLLGAVRHKGFIPWDDDIDLAMPRPDYEQLIATFKSENLYLFNYKNSKRHVMTFSKICSDKTVCYFENKTKLDYGLSIDIFPIDGVPSNEDEFKKNYQKQYQIFNKKFYRGLYWEITDYSYSSGIKKIIQRLIHPFFRSSKWAKVIDLNAKKIDFNSSEQVKTNVTFFNVSPKKSFSKECISQTIRMPFENLQLPCPIGYNQVLTSVYGADYMTPPPEEKRKSTHEEVCYWKDINK